MAESKCSACESYEQRPISGRYNMRCLSCCTRLVLAQRPSKERAAAMLDAIGRVQGAPKREEILAAVKAALADVSRGT